MCLNSWPKLITLCFAYSLEFQWFYELLSGISYCNKSRLFNLEVIKNGRCFIVKKNKLHTKLWILESLQLPFCVWISTHIERIFCPPCTSSYSVSLSVNLFSCVGWLRWGWINLEIYSSFIPSSQRQNKQGRNIHTCLQQVCSLSYGNNFK